MEKVPALRQRIAGKSIPLEVSRVSSCCRARRSPRVPFATACSSFACILPSAADSTTLLLPLIHPPTERWSAVLISRAV